ncbi:MAG: trimeric intracellular cation channel family protein [Clostridia bacterium]|nr:trimeric intracellular cation channel family protein [Clostridia bacterium]
MDVVFFVLEIVGTVAFALSGALTAMKKQMDLLGTIVLAMTTAVGGGIIRDLLIGRTPPVSLVNPLHPLIAVGVAVIAFLPFVQKWLSRTNNTYDLIFNLADAIGLGVFTVVGVNAGFTALGEPNLFLAILLGVFTGVGGGVLRDVMAQNAPTIFVKHFYATASIIGALACALVHMYWSELAASIIGTVVVIVLRVLAMVFKWNLPKPKYFVER